MYICRWNATRRDYNYILNGSRTMRTPRDTDHRRRVIPSCSELGRKKAINLGGGGGEGEREWGGEKDKGPQKKPPGVQTAGSQSPACLLQPCSLL